MTQFELFDFQDECKNKLQKIHQDPIILKWGSYECWAENNKIHYSKWVKKQREFVSYYIVEPIQTYEIHGGIGNQLLRTWKKQIIYRDKEGHEFTELEYWNNQEMSKKEWLNDD